MKEIPLKEIAPAKSSSKKSPSETEVWHLTLDQIEANTGAISNYVYAKASEAGSSTNSFDTGNVLYSKLRPYLNKVVCPTQSGVATSELVPLRPDPEQLDRRYLSLYLRSQIFVKWISSKVAGAKMPRVKMDTLWSHKIPIPEGTPKESLDAQKRIAHLLSQVEALIAQRKQSLQDLDTLLKSVFLDMFGDPVRNEKGWEEKTAIDYAECIVPGRDKPKNFSGNTPWITTNDLHHLRTTYDSKKKIGLTRNEIEHVKAKIIPKGSVLITCVGDLGISSVCGENIVINQQLHSFQVHDSMSNIFFMHAISFQKKFMIRHASKTTLPYMNKSVCNKTPIIRPPLELQKKFETIALKIEKIISAQDSNRIKLENLYSALSQKAFKGELDLSNISLPEELTAVPELQADYSQSQTELEPAKSEPFELTEDSLLKLIGSQAKELDIPTLMGELQDQLTAHLSEDDEEQEAPSVSYEEVSQHLINLLEKRKLTQSYNESENQVLVSLTSA